MESRGFSSFIYVIVALYLPLLKVLSYPETLVGHVTYLKRVIAATFKRCEPFH